MLFFNLREWNGNDHPPLRRQLKVIFDLIFRVTQSKGTENPLEDMFMLRDKTFPDMSRKIAVWFVAQEINESKEIPCISLHRSAADAPMKIIESELLRDRNSSN